MELQAASSVVLPQDTEACNCTVEKEQDPWVEMHKAAVPLHKVPPDAQTDSLADRKEKMAALASWASHWVRG